MRLTTAPQRASTELGARREEGRRHGIPDAADVDDSQVAVDAAIAVGWHAVLHLETASSIAALEQLFVETGQPHDDVAASRT